ncbi:MAG: hypothetical protein KC621_21685, partial [Myxococcales bacterium]|nr:hypothetical protein [Myxococcales bacterium]
GRRDDARAGLERVRAFLADPPAERERRRVGAGSASGITQSSALTLPTPMLRVRVALLEAAIGAH